MTQVPRAVKGLSLVSLFNDFASEMVYPLLPAFVTRTLGGGAELLGLLDGAADLTSALLKVVSGRLADRPRWRGPLILVGYATAVLVRPLISVASAAWQVSHSGRQCCCLLSAHWPRVSISRHSGRCLPGRCFRSSSCRRLR